MAEASDPINPNRRQALWDSGLGLRPGRNGQLAFAAAVNGNVADFTAREKIADEIPGHGYLPLEATW